MMTPVAAVLFTLWVVGEAAFAPHGRLQLPPRPEGAMTGTQFYNLINGIPESQREQHIVNEFARGNVPDFMRTLKPITVTGSGRTLTYYATPDYVAIGSDADFFRMPMSAPLAQQVADIAKCSLPTAKMVNDIYFASELKLAPYPFSPSTYTITSVNVFWLSNQAIENQRSGQPVGLLIGGIKKDVIISPQTRPPPDRVAIYGWHQLNGTPIQSVSLAHESTYEDYSHGIRLVEGVVLMDGAPYPIAEILGHATLHTLLSNEGVIANPRYPIPNPYPIQIWPDLLVNGSFEGDYVGGVAPGWTAWKTTASPTVTYGRASVNRYDGSYSQYFARTDTTPFEAGIRQTVTVVPGKRYEINIWLKRQSTLAGTFMRFGYDLSGGTDGTAASVVYQDLTGTTDNVWVPYTATVTATGTSLTVFARCGHTGTTGGSNSYFYIDAASVRETAN